MGFVEAERIKEGLFPNGVVLHLQVPLEYSGATSNLVRYLA